MREPKTKTPNIKTALAELGAQSARLCGDGVSHLLWVVDPDTDEVSFWQNLKHDEAEAIIELLIKNHGGEVVDRVIDRIIEKDEPPETIH